MTGINWRCKIIAIKAFDITGFGSDADVIASLDYLAQTGARVSNHSWTDYGLRDGTSWPALYAACQALQAKGHLMVCGAGNDAYDNDLPYAAIPSAFDLDNIIAVAAIDSAGNKAGFSNYGATTVDLAAPGVSVASTVLDSNYRYGSGTSMATPHVTGGAALLWAYHPGLTYLDVRNRILSSTKPLASMSGLCVTGGMIDLAPLIVNGVPTAIAGAHQTLEATGPLTSLTLNGSTSWDPDKDPLTFSWLEGFNQVGSGGTVTLGRGVGTYTFDLTVQDQHGASHSDQTVVKIQDTTAPFFGSIQDLTVGATSTFGSLVTFSSPVAQDIVDGFIAGKCAPPSGTMFTPGATVVNVAATDAAGNTANRSFRVNVQYLWTGFLNPAFKQQFNLGTSIPIKFRLAAPSAGITNLKATGYWSMLNGIGVPGPYTAIGLFSYSSGTYQLNWKTLGRAKGKYRIKADFGDGVARTVDLELK